MNTTPRNRYDVFISYARKDYMDEKENIIPGNIISSIKEIFDKENVSYWFDTGEILASDAYAEKITEAIISSDAFLFISSENANSSQWTSKEIALAHHYNKKLIPFRIDESFFNRKVAFYLADIDYIDYHINPERAIDRLRKSIIDPIKSREEEKRKEEEAKKREAERRKKEKEQQQKDLVNEIKIDTDDLDANERKVINEREKLLFKVNKVESEEKRINLIEEIENTILARERKEIRKQVDALQQKNQELEILCSRHEVLSTEHQEQTTALTEKIEALSEDIKRYQEIIAEQKKAIENTGKHKSNSTNAPEKIKTQHSLATKILLAISMISLLISSIWSVSFASGNLTDIDWAIAESFIGLISTFILFLGFINQRVNALIYLFPLIAIITLSTIEVGIQYDTITMWPTTIERFNIYMPFGIIMLIAYVIGICPLIIKNRQQEAD